jgi:hypothetical protein
MYGGRRRCGTLAVASISFECVCEFWQNLAIVDGALPVTSFLS